MPTLPTKIPVCETWSEMPLRRRLYCYPHVGKQEYIFLYFFSLLGTPGHCSWGHHTAEPGCPLLLFKNLGLLQGMVKEETQEQRKYLNPASQGCQEAPLVAMCTALCPVPGPAASVLSLKFYRDSEVSQRPFPPSPAPGTAKHFLSLGFHIGAGDKDGTKQGGFMERGVLQVSLVLCMAAPQAGPLLPPPEPSRQP